MNDLSVIQKVYDLTKWYIPLVHRLPRTHKFGIGDRIQDNLYGLLEGLVVARFSPARLEKLTELNASLDVLRFQSRLLKDFDLIDLRRYEYVSGKIDEIGAELGGWIKQQKGNRAQ
ncbi:MAG: diversity-generating retroelement protein Avd [Candidatus Brocadiia bacterium]